MEQMNNTQHLNMINLPRKPIPKNKRIKFPSSGYTKKFAQNLDIGTTIYLPYTMLHFDGKVPRLPQPVLHC